MGKYVKNAFEPAHVKKVLITQANGEGSGEPAQWRSLARTFTVRSRNTWKWSKVQTQGHISRPGCVAAHVRLKDLKLHNFKVPFLMRGLNHVKISFSDV